MTLRDELEELDCRSVRSLKKVLINHKSSRSLIDQLALLLTREESSIHVKVTWLLKRLAENKTKFTSQQMTAIFDSLPEVNQWEAKLHLCQMLQHVRIPKGSEAKVAWFLERCLLEENKYVRAWAYNGFYELAKQHGEYRQIANEQLDRADAETSAAVKARIRSIRRAMNRLS